MNRKFVLIAAAAIAGILLCAALYLTIPRDPVLPQVVIVYNGEKGDRSFVDSAYRGVFLAQEDMAFDKQEYYSLDRDTIRELLRTPGPQRPGLVITVGYIFADDTRQIAKENPGVRFLGLDQRGSDLPNLKTSEVTGYGGSYLAGVLAATATKSGNVGILLGARSDSLEAFRQGFHDGARAANPAVTVNDRYMREDSSSGFDDPDRAGEIARALYGGGTDIIYTVAGYSGTGAMKAAKERPGRYIIGVDSDQTDLAPDVILASSVKRMDKAVYRGIRDYLNGSFTGGDEVVGLKEGATGLVFNPAFSQYNGTVNRFYEDALAAEAQYRSERQETKTGA